MNGFLLDTNVVSELRRGARTDPGVKAWFGQVEPDALFLSVLVVGELRRGVELVRLRGDPAGAQRLDAWLQRLAEDYADHVLPINRPIAELWGGLGLTRPLPPIDGLLAATALYHDLTLVTRNAKDLAATPVTVLNPFR